MTAFDPFLALRPQEPLGEYLQRLRKTSGRSAEEIADAGGISRGHLYRLEGKRMPYAPSPTLLQAYSEASGVPWLYLLKVFDYIDAEQFANAGFALSLLPERDKLLQRYRMFKREQPSDIQAFLDALEGRAKSEWPLRIAIHVSKYPGRAAEDVAEFLRFVSQGRDVIAGKRNWDDVLSEVHARETDNRLLTRLSRTYADIAALEGVMQLLPGRGAGELVGILRAEGLTSDDISLTKDFIALLRKRRQPEAHPEDLP